MQYLRRFLSFFLLAAVSFYLAPKELLHEFGEHEHTQDVVCTDTCAYHISEAHHHCDCLQLSAPPLYHSVHDFSFVFCGLVCVKPAGSTSDYHFSLSPFLFFRGPPTVS